MTRTRRLIVALLVAAVAVAVVPIDATAGKKQKPKQRDVEITGFSYKASRNSQVEPGETLNAPRCRPDRIIGFVVLKNVRRGDSVRYRWRIDGNLAWGFTRDWKWNRKERLRRVVLSNRRRGLPQGTYQLSVKAEGKRTRIARVKLRC